MSIFEYIRKWYRQVFSSRDYTDIAPDEIFLDSHNRPDFNRYRMEGRLEAPIQKSTIRYLGIFLTILFLLFAGRLWVIQIHQGEAYALESQNNNLDHEVIFSRRGIITDKSGTELAWNEPSKKVAFPQRVYTDTEGLSHTVGYVSPPKKDTSGNYYQSRFIGKDGVEAALDSYLHGENGLKVIEENALGEQVSESTIKRPKNGKNLTLTIDASLQSKMHEIIRRTAKEHNYRGGAGVLMDIQTGEVIALSSYPEYSSQVLTDGGDAQDINELISSSASPFLNRAAEGAYTPGSIVKPFMAIAALNEGVISPNKHILSTGQLRVENPYNPGEYTVFSDWKAHGLVDMRDALAVSSNVYFFQIGGGYKDQQGLGISNIEKYVRAFDLGEKTGIIGLAEQSGVIPSPEWKKEQFGDDPWRLGDTYNTVIGQYGFQVTPLAAARGVGAIATGGTLVQPTLAAGKSGEDQPVAIDITDRHYRVVREGMRQAVTEGTASGLNVSYLDIAAKTGTAEVAGKNKVNSWVIGFYPYDDPQYAFTALMEHGPRKNTIGGVYVMRRLFDWMHSTSSPYIQ